MQVVAAGGPDGIIVAPLEACQVGVDGEAVGGALGLGQAMGEDGVRAERGGLNDQVAGEVLQRAVGIDDAVHDLVQKGPEGFLCGWKPQAGHRKGLQVIGVDGLALAGDGDDRAGDLLERGKRQPVEGGGVRGLVERFLVGDRGLELRDQGDDEVLQDVVAVQAPRQEALRGLPDEGRLAIGDLVGDDLVRRQAEGADRAGARVDLALQELRAVVRVVGVGPVGDGTEQEGGLGVVHTARSLPGAGDAPEPGSRCMSLRIGADGPLRGVIVSPLCGPVRPAHPDPVRFDDHRATLEVREVVHHEEPLEQPSDALRLLIDGLDDDDARGLTWRIRTNVAEPSIERDEHPALARGGSRHLGVGGAAEVFFEHGRALVSEPREHVRRTSGEVLVELQSHVGLGGSGEVSPRASSAP